MDRSESFLVLSERELYDKLMEGWERAATRNGIPYYINHHVNRTQWDHPILQKTIEDLYNLSRIKYAAYRTASKLQFIQNQFKFDQLDLHTIGTVFDRHGHGAYTDLALSVPELAKIVTDICCKTKRDRAAIAFDPDLAAELMINFLLNMFDPLRQGTVQAVSVKIAMATLSNARLSDKYRFYFRHLSDNGIMVIRNRFAQFLRDMIKLPDSVQELRPFGGASVQPSVDSCFRHVANSVGVHEETFHDWLYQEPQALVWLHTMHRMNAAAAVCHTAKCSVCRVMPIVGFRYKCLKCFNYNLCQTCFFTTRISKKHKISHPIQEFCLNATSKEGTRAFVKIIKNNITKDYKKKKYKPKYLPVVVADQSLAWDDYDPGVADENENDDVGPGDRQTTDAGGLGEDGGHDEDDRAVASGLGHDPSCERVICPDDKQSVSRYIVSSPTSDSGPTSKMSADDYVQRRSDQSGSSSIIADVESVMVTRNSEYSVVDRASRDLGSTPSYYVKLNESDSRSSGHLSSGRSVRLPADKAKQLYQLIFQLEDENKVLLEEIEQLCDPGSDVGSLVDQRDQLDKLRQQQELYQARHEILESHNKRLMLQIKRLRLFVESQTVPSARSDTGAISPVQNLKLPDIKRSSNYRFAVSTPKDAPVVLLNGMDGFASPVPYNVQFSETDELTSHSDEYSSGAVHTPSRTYFSLPGATNEQDEGYQDEQAELDFLVRKLNDELPDDFTKFSSDHDDTCDDGDDQSTAADGPLEAARQIGDAMSQFVEKLQLNGH